MIPTSREIDQALETEHALEEQLQAEQGQHDRQVEIINFHLSTQPPGPAIIATDHWRAAF